MKPKTLQYLMGHSDITVTLEYKALITRHMVVVGYHFSFKCRTIKQPNLTLLSPGGRVPHSESRCDPVHMK